MKEENSPSLGRRRWLLGGLGAVAAGAVAVSASSNAAAPASDASGFKPARHQQDAWMGALPGVHRAFIDSSSSIGGITALNYANNILSAHVDDYGGAESEYAMIVCFRHQSTPLGYNDAMWGKYGDSLSGFMALTDSATDKAYMQNPVNIPQRSDLPNRGHTQQEMVGRGVHFVICNRATRAISGMIARANGASAEEVYQELAANLVENARLVSAGVMATTRAQEYGYSMLASA